jgi:hypothetical protein
MGQLFMPGIRNMIGPIRQLEQGVALIRAATSTSGLMAERMGKRLDETR